LSVLLKIQAFWDVTSSHWVSDVSDAHILKNRGAFILRIQQWKKRSQHGTSWVLHT